MTWYLEKTENIIILTEILHWSFFIKSINLYKLPRNSPLLDTQVKIERAWYKSPWKSRRTSSETELDLIRGNSAGMKTITVLLFNILTQSAVLCGKAQDCLYSSFADTWNYALWNVRATWPYLASVIVCWSIKRKEARILWAALAHTAACYCYRPLSSKCPLKQRVIRGCIQRV